MKAVGLFEYGGPEVLRVVELPEPHAASGQVRVKVRAAAINPADVMLRKGLLRAAYEGIDPPFVPGMDVAGTIDEVGDGVPEAIGAALGEDVVALVAHNGRQGGYSEYVVVPAASVTRMPAGARFAQAASFLMNALTARTALDVLGLTHGSTIAVTGSAGAFGGYVVELAAAPGLCVIADVAPQDEALIRSFGATHVVARGDGLAERIRQLVPAGVDAATDGALLGEAVMPAIRDDGKIVLVRSWDGEPGRGMPDVPVFPPSRVSVRTAHTGRARVARASKTTCSHGLGGSQVVRGHRLVPPTRRSRS